MDLSKFTSDGKFLMLALDHRGSFKKMINPASPDSVSDDTVIKLKSEIIQALADQFSGVLIDEVWGVEACKEVCQVKPFLLPLEKSGYMDEGGDKVTELEYSVAQIKEMGASGAKLLIYFNPDAETASKQIDTARKVIEECKAADFPFFLEIVTYGQNSSDRGKFVQISVQKFLDNGVIPSVWKLEYPGSLEECQEVTGLVGETPWILLTGGQNFEDFRGELEIAIKSGARGFLAGRALWQEVCTMNGEEKQKFLEATLPDRFKTIAEIATMGSNAQSSYNQKNPR